MPRRELRSLLFLAAVAAAWMLTQGIADIQSGWLIMAPALVLLVPLLSGRYVGERVLAKVAGRARTPRRRAVASLSARPRAPRATHRRGTLLLAFGLAERGPPLQVA
jgi:hypothetical protein